MSLPIIETPKYEVQIPSTGKVVSYRPYLVREEKILMVALESQDGKQALAAIKDVIKACTFEAIDPNKLTLFDLEYVFLKLRAKSVGETTDVRLRCEKCETYTDNTINLDQIELLWPNGKKEDKTVKLTDKIGLTLQYVTIEKMGNLNLDIKTNVDKMNVMSDMIAASIESIYDENKIYPTIETSRAELDKFIDTLNRTQLDAIEKFLSNMPRLEKKIDFVCSKKECNHANSIVLTGLQSFFA